MDVESAYVASVLRNVSEAVTVEQVGVVSEVNIKALQDALRWLIDQHSSNRHKLADAAEERKLMLERIFALEKKADEADSKQMESLNVLEEKLVAQQAQLEAVKERAATLEVLRADDIAAHAKVAEEVGDLERRVTQDHELAELAAEERKVLREAANRMEEMVDHTKELAKSGIDALRSTVDKFKAERLEPLEGSMRSVTTRLGAAENNLDLRLAGEREHTESKFEETHERINATEQRLDATDARVESVSEARNAPGPNTLQVAPSGQVSEAISEGDKPSAHNTRLAHVEWLLDALQSDFETMHATVNKMKAKQSDQTEHFQDLQAALTNLHRGHPAGGHLEEPAPADEPEGSPPAPAGGGGPSTAYHKQAPQTAPPAGTAVIVPAAAPAAAVSEDEVAVGPRAAGVSEGVVEELERTLMDLSRRMEAAESQLAAVAEERADAVDGSVNPAFKEAIELHLAPLQRAMRAKAEVGDLARVEAMLKAGGGGERKAALATPGTPLGGLGGGGGSSFSGALSQIASQDARLESFSSTLGEVAAQSERLEQRLSALARSSAAESRAQRSAHLRLQALLDGGGLARAATEAARHVMAAPLELIALAMCVLTEGDAWGGGAAARAGGVVPPERAGEYEQPFVGGAASFAEAMEAFLPRRAEGASAGGAALMRVADMLIAGEVRVKADMQALHAAVHHLEDRMAATAVPAAAPDGDQQQPPKQLPPSIHAQIPSSAAGNNVNARRAGSRGGARGLLTRPNSAGALTQASPPWTIGAARVGSGLGGGGGGGGGASAGAGPLSPANLQSVEGRLVGLERSLGPGSSLELRLASLEKASRHAAKGLPQELWGKLWAALNRLQYRVQSMEHTAAEHGGVAKLAGGSCGGGMMSSGGLSSVGELPASPSASQPHGMLSPPERRGSGASLHNQLAGGAVVDVLTEALGGLVAGAGSRQGEALLAAIPGLLENMASGTCTPHGSPTQASLAPSQPSSKQPSRQGSRAASRPPSALRRGTNAPAGGGQGVPTGQQFHLGVTS